jgi:uncharacterized repeat protein (TIGR02543 family)
MAGVTNIVPIGSSTFTSGQSKQATVSWNDTNPIYQDMGDGTYYYSASFNLYSSNSGGTNYGTIATYDNYFTSQVAPLYLNSTLNLAIPSGLSTGTYYVGRPITGTTRIAISVASGSSNITVSFNINGGTGTTPSSLSQPAGSSFTLPTSSGFSRGGYITTQWNTNSSGTGTNYNMGSSAIFSCAILLYARWVANTYAVLIDENGGSAVSDSNYTVSTSSQSVSINRPTAPLGRTFANWSITENTVPTGISPTTFTTNSITIPANDYGQVSIRANYNLINYNITYVLDEGTNSANNPSTYTVASNTIVLENAIKSGFVFSGWYSDSGFTTQVTSIPSGSTGNITLYAKFVANGYTVTFINDGIIVQNTIEEFGNTITFNGNTPTKTRPKYRYIFLGWNTNQEATEPLVNLGTVPVGGITFYAIYQSFLSSLKINGQDVNLKVGETQVKAVYKGETLLWEDYNE